MYIRGGLNIAVEKQKKYRFERHLKDIRPGKERNEEEEEVTSEQRFPHVNS
jgi:hypothetical protein